MESADVLIKYMPILAYAIVYGIALAIAAIVYRMCKDSRVRALVKEFVRAAEKLAETGEIPKADKLSYVEKLLTGLGIKITPVVRAFIEAAVKDLDLIKQEVSNAIHKTIEEETSPEVSEEE